MPVIKIASRASVNRFDSELSRLKPMNALSESRTFLPMLASLRLSDRPTRLLSFY